MNQDSLVQDEVLVSVDHLSKKFCKSLKRSLIYGMQDIGSEILGRKIKHQELRKDEFWAVKDISFQLRRGECLGLIGHNGAGKSTLLKILNGLIKPDSGTVTIKGKVGALIELGAGFNPILTGRENIFNNAAVLGFSREEVEKKFDSIVEFSEIGEFIDTPVQNYSSGMKVRLGFSVAAQLEPDVLIIDEVLAVGDLDFRMKCLTKIGTLLHKSAVIFVSHSMSQISRICTSVLMMEKGTLVNYSTDVSEGLHSFFNSVKSVDKIVSTDGTTRIEDFSIFGSETTWDEENQNYIVQQRTDFNIRLNLFCDSETTRFYVNFGFIDKETRVVANLFSMYDVNPFEYKGPVEIKVSTKEIGLIQGSYNISCSIDGLNKNGVRAKVLYYSSQIGKIVIKGKSATFAPVIFKGNWEWHSLPT